MPPGPVEQAVRQHGVSDPVVLRRAAAIDDAARDLIALAGQADTAPEPGAHENRAPSSSPLRASRTTRPRARPSTRSGQPAGPAACHLAGHPHARAERSRRHRGRSRDHAGRPACLAPLDHDPPDGAGAAAAAPDRVPGGARKTPRRQPSRRAVTGSADLTSAFPCNVAVATAARVQYAGLCPCQQRVLSDT